MFGLGPVEILGILIAVGVAGALLMVSYLGLTRGRGR